MLVAGFRSKENYNRGIRKKISNFQKFTKKNKKVSVKKWKLDKINRIPLPNNIPKPVQLIQ
jgi:hypothetical protein